MSGTYLEGLCCLACISIRVQKLCESRGGRPGLPVLRRLMASVHVKRDTEPCLGTGHSLSLISVSTGIRGHEALNHHHHHHHHHRRRRHRVAGQQLG